MRGGRRVTSQPASRTSTVASSHSLRVPRGHGHGQQQFAGLLVSHFAVSALRLVYGTGRLGFAGEDAGSPTYTGEAAGEGGMATSGVQRTAQQLCSSSSTAKLFLRLRFCGLGWPGRSRFYCLANGLV